MPRKRKKPVPVETVTGVGQLRRVHKRTCSSEQEAFARLVKRGVAKKKYVWQAEHTEKSWAWRRVG